MFVPHLIPLNNGHRDTSALGINEMAKEEKQQFHKYVNEQGEETKMSVSCLLNSPSEIIHIKSNNGLRNSTSDFHRSKELIVRPSYDEPYIEFIEGSPPTTPTITPIVNTPPGPQRAPCSVCKSENGRCHASDPVTMQNFFHSALGFDGVLNVADWLCMKCYSKWYNRCKRKATSSLAMTVVDPSHPFTQQKRRRREKDKDLLPKVSEAEKRDAEDTDSDDALLLARIGGRFPTSAPPESPSSSNDIADLETASIEELRAQVSQLRKDLRRVKTEITQRDEQIEGLISFVRTEVGCMHGLLKEIYTTRWSSSYPSSAPCSQPSSAAPSPAASPILSRSTTPSPIPPMPLSSSSSIPNHQTLPAFSSLPISSMHHSFNIPSMLHS